MKTHDTLASGFDASIKGALRALGFFLLCLIFIPTFAVFRLIAPRTNPFLYSSFLYRAIVKAIGIRLRIHGKPTTNASTLFVANHSSYLDIIVLGAAIPAAFVAKSEVASWPFFGFMARLQGTVFIERNAKRAGVQRNALTEHLGKGTSLILFPEGTSSDGTRTLPFKSSLFSIAEQPLPNGQAVTVQPVSTLCTGIYGLPMSRAWRPYYAWYGDMTLMGHLWDMFRIGHFTVDIFFHDPVTIRDFANRKAMADYCQNKISGGVETCVTGRITKEPAPVPQLPKG